MNRFWKSIFIYSIASLIAFFVYLYMHLGLQKPVTIEKVRQGPIWLLYKEHRGAYHEIGPVIRDVEAWASAQNIPCPKTFGEYIDDPSGLDQDRLRSHGGCVINGPVNKDLPDGFQQKELPAADYITARFEGSPAAGPMKVYPAVKKFADTQRIVLKGPVFEFYNVSGANVTTEYLFSLP